MNAIFNSKKRRVLSVFLAAIFLIPFISFAEQPPAYLMKTIVLDAGHGGHDSGAKGSQSLEKDLALEVVLKLGKAIEKQIPGIRVVYTRKVDVFVPLYKRIELANENKADLFISIHCNSGGNTSVRTKNSSGRYVTSTSLNRSARGTETLVSGSSRLGEQDAAVRENASMLLEENYKANYQGFDPKDPESYIIFSLMKNQYRDQSIKLANAMQTEYTNSGRVNRGVWEKSLAVLARAGMPAVLTEIGFISNYEEERMMMSNEGQEEIVQNLVNAIRTYKKSVEK